MTPERNDYLQQFADCLDYQSDPSGAMVARFIQACRMLRLLTPANSIQSQGGTARFQTELDVGQIASMEQDAQRWQTANVSRSPFALLNTAQVPRQFGLNRLRPEHIPDGPPYNAGVH